MPEFVVAGPREAEAGMFSDDGNIDVEAVVPIDEGVLLEWDVGGVTPAEYEGYADAWLEDAVDAFLSAGNVPFDTMPGCVPVIKTGEATTAEEPEPVAFAPDASNVSFVGRAYCTFKKPWCRTE